MLAVKTRPKLDRTTVSLIKNGTDNLGLDFFPRHQHTDTRSKYQWAIDVNNKRKANGLQPIELLTPDYQC